MCKITTKGIWKLWLSFVCLLKMTLHSVVFFDQMLSLEMLWPVKQKTTELLKILVTLAGFYYSLCLIVTGHCKGLQVYLLNNHCSWFLFIWCLFVFEHQNNLMGRIENDDRASWPLLLHQQEIKPLPTPSSFSFSFLSLPSPMCLKWKKWVFKMQVM